MFIKVKNPREGIQHATIDRLGGMYCLRVRRTNLSEEDYLYRSELAAKRKYAEMYQPSKKYDKPIWVEYFSQ